MKNVKLQDITTGIWNVRSLYRAGHLTTAISELEWYWLDIIAIQVRWLEGGNLKTRNCILFYSGGPRHQLGFGFIVNDKILPRIKKFRAVDDRIYYIEMEYLCFNVILINGYAPTEDKIKEEIKSIFYESLDTLCDLISPNKVKILLKDINVKVGQEIIYRPIIGKESLWVHRESNDKGTRLINFTLTRNMIVSSTTFAHKDIHKNTWVSPTGQIKNQIDHVTVDRQIKKYIMDVRNIRGSSAISDHFIVRVKIKRRLSVEWRKKAIPIKRINTEGLKNQEIKKQHKTKLKETFWVMEGTNNVDNLWNEIENSTKILTTTEVLRFEKRKTMKKCLMNNVN